MNPAHDVFRRLEQLNQIGVALSKERDINSLLESILIAAMELTRADGGTLYLMSEKRDSLVFTIMRNNSMEIALGGTTGRDIELPSLPLVTPDGNAEVNYAFEQQKEPFSSIPPAFGAFNTGVFAFRKSPASLEFLRLWQQNHETHVRQHTTNDQPAFRLSLFQSQVRYHVLPVTYNWFSWIPYFIPSGGRVMVMHGRNPWLFKRAREFDAPTATIVGSISWRHQWMLWSAKVLHWLSRRGIISRPEL